MSLKKRLLEGLTSIYDKSQDSNIAKLITIITNQIEDIYIQKDKVEDSRNVDQAFGHTLDRIGGNVQQERGALDDPSYRLLIKSKVARNKSTGDINTLLDVMEVMLDIEKKDIVLEENPGGEPASVYIEIPLSSIGQYNITRSNFVIILNRLVAAGVRAYTMLNGSFELGDSSSLEYDSTSGLGDVNDSSVGGELGSWHQPINVIELPDWQN